VNKTRHGSAQETFSKCCARMPSWALVTQIISVSCHWLNDLANDLQSMFVCNTLIITDNHFNCWSWLVITDRSCCCLEDRLVMMHEIVCMPGT